MAIHIFVTFGRGHILSLFSIELFFTPYLVGAGDVVTGIFLSVLPTFPF